jgi:hypothetical protein
MLLEHLINGVIEINYPPRSRQATPDRGDFTVYLNGCADRVDAPIREITHG